MSDTPPKPRVGNPIGRVVDDPYSEAVDGGDLGGVETDGGVPADVHHGPGLVVEPKDVP